jgi:opacity protein-like surface antigen
VTNINRTESIPNYIMERYKMSDKLANDRLHVKQTGIFNPIFILTLLLILTISGSTSVSAQEFQLGIDFAGVFPQSEFKETLNENGYGVGGQFLFRLGSSPVLVGGDLVFANYGLESREEPISTTLPNLRVRVDTENYVVMPHLLLRLQPNKGAVRPYVDGLVGFKYLATTTTISDDYDNDVIDSDTELSDTAFSYGIGGGVQIELAKFQKNAILLDTKVRYIRGGNAKYLKEGSIQQVNGQTTFDVLSSRTDVLTTQVGVTFRF